MTDCMLCGGDGCDACVAPAARVKERATKQLSPAQERRAARRAARRATPTPKRVAREADEFGDALRTLDAFGLLATVEKQRHARELVPRIDTVVRNRLAEHRRKLH